jgi:hypothetical protein
MGCGPRRSALFCCSFQQYHLSRFRSVLLCSRAKNVSLCLRLRIGPPPPRVSRDRNHLRSSITRWATVVLTRTVPAGFTWRNRRVLHAITPAVFKDLMRLRSNFTSLVAKIRPGPLDFAGPFEAELRYAPV